MRQKERAERDALIRRHGWGSSGAGHRAMQQARLSGML